VIDHRSGGTGFSARDGDRGKVRQDWQPGGSCGSCGRWEAVVSSVCTHVCVEYQMQSYQTDSTCAACAQRSAQRKPCTALRALAIHTLTRMSRLAVGRDAPVGVTAGGSSCVSSRAWGASLAYWCSNNENKQINQCMSVSMYV
jgi:hypothetical protein